MYGCDFNNPYRLRRADGASPFDNLIAESNGDLFGTTAGRAGGAVG